MSQSEFFSEIIDNRMEKVSHPLPCVKLALCVRSHSIATEGESEIQRSRVKRQKESLFPAFLMPSFVSGLPVA